MAANFVTENDKNTVREKSRGMECWRHTALVTFDVVKKKEISAITEDLLHFEAFSKKRHTSDQYFF